MHPILLQVTENFYIGTYGVMIALGLLAAVALAAWRAKRAGMTPDPVIDLTFIAVVAGFLGARLTYIVVNWGEFLRAPGELLLSRSGFVFLGGLLFAAAACAVYLHWKGLNFWRMGDILAPSVAVGHGFGRVGCHFAGCCHGEVCGQPHGFCLSVPRIETAETGLWPNAYYDQVLRGVIGPEAEHSLPIWPVQLMETGGLFLLAGALLLLSRRVFPLGTLVGIYMAAYAVLRFGLEFLRGDPERGLFFGETVSTSQILSVALLGLGVWVLASAWRSRGDPDASRLESPSAPQLQKETGKRKRKRPE